MNAVMSEKGQVTIPKELRDKLGLKPGTVLEFGSAQGVLTARKKVAEDVFEKWRGRGKLPAGKNTDDYLHIIRDGHSH